MTLHVLATFIARSDTVGEVQTLLASLVEPIRNDPGCLRCHLVVDNAKPEKMIFVEEWTSGDALDLHLADAFVGQVVEKVAPLLAQPLTLDRHDAIG